MPVLFITLLIAVSLYEAYIYWHSCLILAHELICVTAYMQYLRDMFVSGTYMVMA